MNIHEQKNRIKQIMGLSENIEDINYTNPNFDTEWQEAKRYINHPQIEKKIKWTKEEWLNKVKNGKIIKFSEIKNLENITNHEEFNDLFPEKVERFITAFAKKNIELPIAVKYPNGRYELIAGNTRVAGLRLKGYDPKIWVFDL